MKSTEVFVAASKETELEVTADKIKYMVMYRDQNAGRSQNIKTDNESFEIVEQFKYFGTNLTNQNSNNEIKSRLNSMNAYFQLVQNLCLPVCYLKALRIIQNCNFACCCVCVWNLVSHSEGGM
jgi:hypothetical protein